MSTEQSAAKQKVSLLKMHDPCLQSCRECCRTGLAALMPTRVGKKKKGKRKRNHRTAHQNSLQAAAEARSIVSTRQHRVDQLLKFRSETKSKKKKARVNLSRRFLCSHRCSGSLCDFIRVVVIEGDVTCREKGATAGTNRKFRNPVGELAPIFCLGDFPT